MGSFERTLPTKITARSRLWCRRGARASINALPRSRERRSIWKLTGYSSLRFLGYMPYLGNSDNVVVMLEEVSFWVELFRGVMDLPLSLSC